MNLVADENIDRGIVELLDRVSAGEHIVTIRGGRPVAELRPVATPHLASRPFGLAAGSFTVPDDFDSPLSTVDTELAAYPAPLLPRNQQNVPHSLAQRPRYPDGGQTLGFHNPPDPNRRSGWPPFWPIFAVH